MKKYLINTKKRIGNKDHNKKVIFIRVGLTKLKLLNPKLLFYNQIYQKNKSNIKAGLKIVDE